jgi:hypothetical protein
MRQGQQNRRGRGRNNNNNNNNNNNRKGQHHHNPLMRTFQSNGPDQKIHGTPAQIAEKYMSLARDALSSGDPVLAENYLQHAEHYNRIILTYREQQMQQGEGMNGGMNRGGRPYQQNEQGEGNEDGDDEGDDQPEAMGGGGPGMRGFEPQPDVSQRGPDGGFRDQGARDGNRQFRPRHGGDQRGFNQDRGDRPGRGDHPRGDFQRPDRQHDRPDRMSRPERPDRADRPDRVERSDRSEHPRAERERAVEPPPEQAAAPLPALDAPRRKERVAEPPQHEQPEFLRRPVRRPRREATPPAGGDSEAPAVVATDAEGRE